MESDAEEAVEEDVEEDENAEKVGSHVDVFHKISSISG